MTKKLKFSKKFIGAFVLVLVIGYVSGLVTNSLMSGGGEVKNVRVWAVDTTVKIPNGLEDFLVSDHQNDCKEYRGTGSPTGVALFAVYQSVDNKFAKMYSGCSDDLRSTFSTVAIKHDGKWVLPQSVEYFSGVNSKARVAQPLPQCSQVNKYQITKRAEPECADDKGVIQNNNIQ